jgi:hypothetical protein
VVHAVAPVNTAPPAISGNPSAGQTLSCSQGAWSGTSPKSYGFRWLRDGSPIEGATGASYVVMDVDQGHALTCQVTAHNEAGDATATSAAVQVPTPAANTVAVSGIGTPVPTPANLRASGLKVGARSLVLTLQCRGVAGQICKGKVTLSARRGRGKQVTVGSASFSIAAGKSKRLTIGLNKTGRSMLRHSRSLPARLTVALTGAAKPIVSKAIAFKKKRR